MWLPNDAPLSLTNQTAQQTEHDHPPRGRRFRARAFREKQDLLTSVTTFVGGGGSRFWFSVSPEQQQRNYSQVLIQLKDKEVTPELIAPLQSALSTEIPGAYLTVHQLQTNPVEFPLEVRISGVSDVDPKQEPEDNANLRRLAGQVQDILRAAPGVQVVQNDWFEESPEVKLKIDPDRANLAGPHQSRRRQFHHRRHQRHHRHRAARRQPADPGRRAAASSQSGRSSPTSRISTYLQLAESRPSCHCARSPPFKMKWRRSASAARNTSARSASTRIRSRASFRLNC